MKKITQIGLLLALILGFSVESQAALLIEPVVGYSIGKFNSETDTAGDVEKDDHSARGTSYGGRLGYQNFGFQLGVDYLASKMTQNDEDFNTSEFGGFVGFEFPILLRVYAGYVFSGTADTTVDDEEIELSGGKGPKVGIGFTVLPFLDLNLEYRSITYNTEDEDLGAGVEFDSDYQALMFGISLPFTL